MNPADSPGATVFSVGLEEGPDGAAHVHSLSVPGCISSGRGREEALGSFPAALSAWLDFLESAGQSIPPRSHELNVSVDEWITTDAAVSSGESNVCFESDRRPLDDADLRTGLHLLGCLRSRLLPRIRRTRDEDLATLEYAVYDVRQLLDELARAQWLTLTRLGSSPLALVPDRVVARLDTAMALIIQHLGHLPAEHRARTIVIEDEEWTPRKVLRRLLWLEWELGGAALRALGDPVPSRR